jgi:TolB protein
MRAGAVLCVDALDADARPTTLLHAADIGPVYLYWAPDSRHLSALVQRADSLVLYLLDAEGLEPARTLLVGNPLYWSWASDGQRLAIHVGGDAHTGPDAWIGVLHLDGAEDRFADPPGEFRAPAWSADGERLAYAVLEGEQSVLVVREQRGHVSRVASGPTELAFTWAPGGDWLAFSSRLTDTPGVYEGLEVARPEGGDRRRLAEDPIVAFYWAPDGSRLAYLRLDTRAQALGWSVVGLDGRAARSLASFTPSDDFAFQLAFFDQYAQSTSVWSPDGRRLLYGSDASGQRRNGSTVSEHISVLDVDGAEAQARPAQVARGGLAVWSPASPR